MSKHYYVYILANVSRRLYVGVTNNLERCDYVILTVGKKLNGSIEMAHR
jgi:hypothetical protein